MAFPVAGSLGPVLHREEAILEFGGAKLRRKVLGTKIHWYTPTINE
jgi:hypothetical protein